MPITPPVLNLVGPRPGEPTIDYSGFFRGDIINIGGSTVGEALQFDYSNFINDPLFRVPQTDPVQIPPPTIINNSRPITPIEITATAAGAYSRLGIVYGRTRVVGKLLKFRVSGNYISFSYIFCRSPVDNVETLIIDGRSADVSANSGGASFSSAELLGTTTQIDCQIFEGTSGQDVSAWWNLNSRDATQAVSQSDTWANYCIVCFDLDSRTTEIRSFPRVEAIIKGQADVRDPRVSPGIAYTNNPALCLAHFLENYVDTSKTVDNTSLTEAANYHDESVASPHIARKTLNIWLNRRQDIRATIALLEQAAGVFIQEEGDTWHFQADKAATSTHTIDESRIVKGTTRFRRAGQVQAPADVRVIWYDPDANEPGIAEALGNTSGPFLEVDMPWITTYQEAKREAIQQLNHLTNEDSSISLTVKGEGLKYRRGEVATITHASMSLSQDFRLQSVRNPSPGVWAVSGTEYQAGTYSNDVSTDPIAPDHNLPDPSDVPAMTNVVMTASNSPSTSDGTESAQIVVSWDEVTFLFARKIELELYTQDESPIRLIAAQKVPAGFTKATFANLPGLVNYSVRARIDAANFKGAWTDAVDTSVSPNATTIQTPKDTTAPSAPANVTAVYRPDGWLISWDDVTDVDADYYEVEKVSTASPQVATTLTTRLKAAEYLYVTETDQPAAFRVYCYDRSGNKSTAGTYTVQNIAIWDSGDTSGTVTLATTLATVEAGNTATFAADHRVSGASSIKGYVRVEKDGGGGLAVDDIVIGAALNNTASNFDTFSATPVADWLSNIQYAFSPFQGTSIRRGEVIEFTITFTESGSPNQYFFSATRLLESRSFALAGSSFANSAPGAYGATIVAYVDNSSGTEPVQLKLAFEGDIDAD